MSYTHQRKLENLSGLTRKWADDREDGHIFKVKKGACNLKELDSFNLNLSECCASQLTVKEDCHDSQMASDVDF